ncbi:MAG: response regulator [Glycocaulis sp.]|uniref:response regulator n=1 Tax=Glycocaulis sp. TaxID=1969725 RepID=UPI003F6EE52F
MGDTTQPARILLIEDDDTEAELFAGMLVRKSPECTVSRAASGRAALAQLASSPLPDCVVLDLRLPGEDGIWILERLLESPEWRAIPVIVFSGDVSRLGPASSQYPNVASSVRKPHSVEEYEAALLIVCAIVGATVSAAA